jgi:hypothetical protein
MATETSESTTSLKQKLQQHLDQAKQRLDSAKQDIANLREQDKESIRKTTTDVQNRIAATQQRAREVRAQMSAWFEDKKKQNKDVVASWKEKLELKSLERRAENAEEYAVGAVAIAMIDADEAEMAVLEALDARLDVEDATSKAK